MDDQKKGTDLFDFSETKVGDRVTRIYQDSAWDADVVEVTEDIIRCSMIVDTERIMKFDRKTGISEHGKAFGFIINKPIEKSYEFMVGFKLGSRQLSLEEIIKEIHELTDPFVETEGPSDLLDKYLKDTKS